MKALLSALVAIFFSVAARGADHESSLRVSSSLAEYPDNPDFYDESSETSSKYLWRQVVKGGWGGDGDLRYEANAYLLMIGSSNKVSGLNVLSSGTEELNRCSYLDHYWHDSDSVDGYLTLDRLNLRGEIGSLQWVLGRFPVNFSTTYIFTPNDLFAPFRPHHAYREYKPGVDGVRIDYPWGELGQVSLLAVAGYRSDSKIGRVGIQKENKFDAGESSTLLRVANTFAGHELAVLGGKNAEFDLVGFSTQGEVFEIGVKSEGHQRKSRKDGFAASEVALAFEYRVFETLLLQFEEYYHGSGYRSAEQYRKIEDDPHPPLYFLGTQYSALMLQYEWSNLTQLRPILIGNHTDQSAMFYVSAQRSISEMSELTVSFLLPRGKGPDKEFLRSEYGAYPSVLTVDFAVYF